MKGVVQQKGNLYLVQPKIMLPPINRDTPQNVPVLNGGISAGYLYFSLKSEEIGISRLPLALYKIISSFTLIHARGGKLFPVDEHFRLLPP